MKVGFHFSFIVLLFSFIPVGKAQVELVNLRELSTEFIYEIRYATPDNFLGQQLYECDECLFQKEVAEALVAANHYFCELGYRIKIYDCYRPLAIQKTMWAKMPNPTYIANPNELGSVHNRGAAVDLTLETLDGCFVDMGSDYDYFGQEAHIDNYHLPETVLQNRKLLQTGLQKFGFQTIRTEWWHFSYYKMYQYRILNSPLPCAK